MGKHSAALRADPNILRARIEADIERLIELLDRLDGDPEREPSLGGGYFGFSSVDLEGDDSDFEPSLGWEERSY